MPTTVRSRRTSKSKPIKFSRLHAPEGFTLEQWQTQLRRDFGREQQFRFKNAGGQPVFSEFLVNNPQTSSTYRVIIRGRGLDSCSCPDFATNTLGTCKHVEFIRARLAENPARATALREGFNPPYSEILLQYGARRDVRFVPGAECHPRVASLAQSYFDKDGLLFHKAYATFDKFLAEVKWFKHEVRCADEAVAFIAEVRDAHERRRRIDAAFPKGARGGGFEGLVKADLYEYQKEGALFAARAGRSLIGDEMGLGKTVQAIAAAEIMARHLGVSRVLIVCPTSLKHQWERELARFTGRSARIIGGPLAQRKELFAAEAFFKITNYDTLHRDLEAIRHWSPDLVILDEAQRIKNWNTRAARTVKRIVSPYAIVLTGTPLENRLEELVSIVQFVDQHRLGPTFRFLADHQIRDDVGRVIGYRDLDTIGKSLAPVLIRRRKTDVLKQLPGRLDKNFFVPMTPQQMQHHEENREIVARIVAKWRRYRYLSEGDQRRLMVALQNMRMSCNSTYLLDQTTDHGVKADELMTLLAELYERPDAKVVVFSQWVRTHELLTRRMNDRKFGHVLFHGGIPGAKRGQLIDRFREDDSCRAFLSTDAGGVGLNLQHASVVVNMDLPWNPAVLEQRIGRVHRLGQKRPVQVINFVSQGTIEESMLSVLKFKKSLFSGALDGGANEVFLGGSRLNRFMETVEKAAGTIPAPDAPETPVTPETASAGAEAPAAAEEIEPKPAVDSLVGLLEIGASLLREIAPTPGSATSGGRPDFIRRDPATGQTYLHLPVPKPEALERFLAAASEFLTELRR